MLSLKCAVKTKLIPSNPADGCDLPRMDTSEVIALNAEQLEAYERAAAGSWADLLIQLAAASVPVAATFSLANGLISIGRPGNSASNDRCTKVTDGPHSDGFALIDGVSRSPSREPGTEQ
jgi:hypothetical protein